MNSEIMMSEEKAETIRREISALGDWYTGFVHEGRNFGGQYFAEFDTRMLPFVDQVLKSGITSPKILECGCFEGGHTTAIAMKVPNASITAVDARTETQERARKLAAIRGLDNIRFALDDLDAPQNTFHDSYDFIYCVGLLYHLRWPYAFLEKCAKASPRLWLWTMLCLETEAVFTEGRYRGRLYVEPVEHPLSGLREASFLLNCGSLCDMLWQVGYRKITIMNLEERNDGVGSAVLLSAEK